MKDLAGPELGQHKVNAHGSEKKLADSPFQERQVVRINDLGSLLKQKRRAARLTLEQVAKQSGVSPATLSRIERRATEDVTGREMSTLDMRTLRAVTEWLGVAVTGEGFAPDLPTFSPETSEANSIPNVVEAHLRADRNLKPEAAAILARIFRSAYSEFAQDDPGASSAEHDDAASKETRDAT